MPTELTREFLQQVREPAPALVGRNLKHEAGRILRRFLQAAILETEQPFDHVRQLRARKRKIDPNMNLLYKTAVVNFRF